jgi:hypothetical protein
MPRVFGALVERDRVDVRWSSLADAPRAREYPQDNVQQKRENDRAEYRSEHQTSSTVEPIA